MDIDQYAGNKTVSQLQRNIQDLNQQVIQLESFITNLSDSSAAGQQERDRFNKKAHDAQELSKDTDALLKKLVVMSNSDKDLPGVCERLQNEYIGVLNRLQASQWRAAQTEKAEIIAAIRIKMDGKEENVALSENFITESIRHAFLLPPEAIVKLSYEINNMHICCGTRMDQEGCFLLPNGWSTIAFFAESDKAPSRPATPMDTSSCTATVYIPIETGALVHKLENFLFYEKGDTKACFTVISLWHAVSFNHGPHKYLNSNSAEIQTVIICNQSGQEFRTKLIESNSEVDFVVVLSEVPLVSEPPTVFLPRQLERYILLGYPNVDSSYEALEGIISSVRLDDKGRMRGSSGSQRGYSGGPIFNYRGELLGINVANESSQKFIGLSGQSTLAELFSEVNVAFPSLSVIVPVYYLAMRIHLNFHN